MGDQGLDPVETGQLREQNTDRRGCGRVQGEPLHRRVQGGSDLSSAARATGLQATGHLPGHLPARLSAKAGRRFTDNDLQLKPADMYIYSHTRLHDRLVPQRGSSPSATGLGPRGLPNSKFSK